MPNPIVEFQTQTGAPIHLDGKSIQVRSRALVLRFPRSTGGLVWNRPISISVQTTDGREETLPIHDTTRLIELVIFGSILFFTLLIGLMWRKVS
ncbi:MAG: hypothetical protein ACM3S0_00575 [Acidobacteriota bacterium]